MQSEWARELHVNIPPQDFSLGLNITNGTCVILYIIEKSY
jgi:hypothetical protein